MKLRQIAIPLLASLAALSSCSCRPSALVKGEDPFGLDCPGVTAHTGKVETFLVVGHRGAAGKSVENTIASMVTAMTEGANAVEVDISITKDRVAVLWHDWDPDSEIAVGRQSGAEDGVAYRPMVPKVGDPMRRRVSDLTLEELRRVNGYADKDDKPANVEIPTIDQFAQWALGEPRLRAVLIDVKTPEDEADLGRVVYEKVIAALPQSSRKFDLIFSTPHGAVWERLRSRPADTMLAYEIDPALVLLDTADCDSSSSTKGGGIENAAASTVQPKGHTLEAFSSLKSRLGCDLEARDGRGTVKKVFAATLNEQDRLECLVDLGVDGIVTDEPALLRKIVNDKGRK